MEQGLLLFYIFSLAEICKSPDMLAIHNYMVFVITFLSQVPATVAFLRVTDTQVITFNPPFSLFD